MTIVFFILSSKYIFINILFFWLFLMALIFFFFKLKWLILFITDLWEMFNETTLLPVRDLTI